jgi:hypothetical protein
MTHKDLTTKEHLVLFSKEEIDQGYKFCNDTMYALKNRFPGHTFVGIPDTIVVKDLGKEAARAVIDELQEYLDSLEEEELWEVVNEYIVEHTTKSEEAEENAESAAVEETTDEQQQL